MTLPQGEKSSSSKQPSSPAATIPALAQTRLSGWRFKATEARDRGRGGECICVCVCVCVIVCSQCLWNGGGSKSVSLQCSSQGNFPTAALAKKIRLRLFCLGASNRIPIPRLLSLSILVSTINFPLQSRELLCDRIHIAVNSLSLNADRSSHCFNHDGQPCEALDSCSRFLNSSITQGKA